MLSNGCISNGHPTSATTPTQSDKNCHDDTTLTSRLPWVSRASTSDLEKILENHGLIPTKDEITRCENALKVLDRFVQDWIKTVSLQKSIPMKFALEARAKLFTCGSYLLGVQDKLSEIEVICVFPKHIDHDDFFCGLQDFLHKKEEISNLTRFSGERCRVLKMTLDGVSLSVGYVLLFKAKISDNLEVQQKNVQSINKITFRSYLLGKEILKSVPNVDTFRMALRAVKCWAKINGVYSCEAGYLDGPSWSLLVARTCQEYPNANAAYIVYNFFQDFSNWNWPTPVTLKAHPENHKRGAPFLMPVLSPIDPYEDTAGICYPFCKDVTVKELKRGSSIANEIICGEASWGKLFQAHSFLESYSHYIVVSVVAKSAADLREWSRYIPYSLKILQTPLKNGCPFIKLMRIWPSCFEPVDLLRDPGKRFWLMGLEADTCGDTISMAKVKSVLNQHTEYTIDHILQGNFIGRGAALTAQYIDIISLKELCIRWGPEIRNYIYAIDPENGDDIQNGQICMANDRQIEILGSLPPMNLVEPNLSCPSLFSEFFGLEGDDNSADLENVTDVNKEEQSKAIGEETDARLPSVLEDNYSWCTPEDREWIKVYERTGTLPSFQCLKPPNYPTW